MSVVTATMADVPDAIHTLADAFANDPMMIFLFQGDATSRLPLLREYFSVYMSARMAANIPVWILKDGNRVQGVAMGYDSGRPKWPPDLVQRLTDLATQADAAERFAKYEAVAKRHEPTNLHHYLGALGVRSKWRGKGVGTQLLETFVYWSGRDSASSGIQLETSQESNVAFYMRHGFKIMGSGALDRNVMLWCLFRPRTMNE